MAVNLTTTAYRPDSRSIVVATVSGMTNPWLSIACTAVRTIRINDGESPVNFITTDVVPAFMIAAG